MAYLLSDNKVGVNNLSDVRPRCLGLQELKNLKEFDITPPQTDSVFPPPKNIFLIR